MIDETKKLNERPLTIAMDDGDAPTKTAVTVPSPNTNRVQAPTIEEVESKGIDIKDFDMSGLTDKDIEERSNKLFDTISKEGEDSFRSAFDKSLFKDKVLMVSGGFEDEFLKRLEEQKAFLASQNITDIPQEGEFGADADYIAKMDEFVTKLKTNRPDLVASLKSSKDILFDIRTKLLDSQKINAGFFKGTAAELTAHAVASFSTGTDATKTVANFVGDMIGTSIFNAATGGIALPAKFIYKIGAKVALSAGRTTAGVVGYEAVRNLSSRENEVRKILAIPSEDFFDRLKVTVPASLAFHGALATAAFGTKAITRNIKPKVSPDGLIIEGTYSVIKDKEITVSEKFNNIKEPEARAVVYENFITAGEIIDNANPAMAKMNVIKSAQLELEELSDHNKIAIASLLNKTDAMITPDEFESAIIKSSEAVPFKKENIKLVNDIIEELTSELNVGVPKEKRLTPFDKMVAESIEETRLDIAQFRARELNYVQKPFERLSQADKIVIAKILDKDTIDITEKDFAKAIKLSQEKKDINIPVDADEVFIDSGLMKAKQARRNQFVAFITKPFEYSNIGRANFAGWYVGAEDFVAEDFYKSIGKSQNVLSKTSTDYNKDLTDQLEKLGLIEAGQKISSVDDLSFLFDEGTNEGLKEEIAKFTEDYKSTVVEKPADYNKAFLDQLKKLRLEHIKVGESISATDISYIFNDVVDKELAREIFDFVRDYNNYINDLNIKEIADNIVSFKANSIRVLNTYRNNITSATEQVRTPLNYKLREVIDHLPGSRNLVTGQLTIAPETQRNIWREVSGQYTNDESARKAAYKILNSFLPAVRSSYNSAGLIIRPMSDWLPVIVNPMRVAVIEQDVFVGVVTPLLDFERISNAMGKPVVPTKYVRELYRTYQSRIGSSGNVTGHISSALDQLVKKQLFFRDGNAWITFHEMFADSIDPQYILGEIAHGASIAVANYRLFGSVNNGDKLIDYIIKNDTYRYDSMELENLERIREYMGARRHYEVGKLVRAARDLDALLKVAKLGRSSLVEALTTKANIVLQLTAMSDKGVLNTIRTTLEASGLTTKFSAQDAEDLLVIQDNSYTAMRGDLSERARIASDGFFKITLANKAQNQNTKTFIDLFGRALYSMREQEWSSLPLALKNTFTKNEWDLIRTMPEARHVIRGTLGRRDVNIISPTKLFETLQYQNVPLGVQRIASSAAGKFTKKINDSVLKGDKLSTDSISELSILKYGRSAPEDVVKTLWGNYLNFSNILLQLRHTVFSAINSLYQEKRYGAAGFTIATLLASGYIVNLLTNIATGKKQTKLEEAKAVWEMSGLSDFYLSKTFDIIQNSLKSSKPTSTDVVSHFTPVGKLSWDVMATGYNSVYALHDKYIGDEAALNRHLSEAARHASASVKAFLPKNLPIPYPEGALFFSDALPDKIIKTLDPYSYVFFAQREERKLPSFNEDRDIDKKISNERYEASRLREANNLSKPKVEIPRDAKELELQQQQELNALAREQNKALRGAKSDFETNGINALYKDKAVTVRRKYSRIRKQLKNK